MTVVELKEENTVDSLYLYLQSRGFESFEGTAGKYNNKID